MDPSSEAATFTVFFLIYSLIIGRPLEDLERQLIQLEKEQQQQQQQQRLQLRNKSSSTDTNRTDFRSSIQ